MYHTFPDRGLLQIVVVRHYLYWKQHLPHGVYRAGYYVKPSVSTPTQHIASRLLFVGRIGKNKRTKVMTVQIFGLQSKEYKYKPKGSNLGEPMSECSVSAAL